MSWALGSLAGAFLLYLPCIALITMKSGSPSEPKISLTLLKRDSKMLSPRFFLSLSERRSEENEQKEVMPRTKEGKKKIWTWGQSWGGRRKKKKIFYFVSFIRENRLTQSLLDRYHMHVQPKQPPKLDNDLPCAKADTWPPPRRSLWQRRSKVLCLRLLLVSRYCFTYFLYAIKIDLHPFPIVRCNARNL